MTSDAQAKKAAAAQASKIGWIRPGIFYSLLVTLLADVCASRAASLLHLTLWSWILHLLYFELPLSSCNRVIWLHGPSLGGSVALWNMYLWTLYANPQMEFDLAPEGRPEWLILIRAAWLHAAPVIFHMVDLHWHSRDLQRAYRSATSNGRGRLLQWLWSSVGGYLAMGLTWEYVNGDATATYHVTVVSEAVYVNVSKVVGIGSCLFTFWLFTKPLLISKQ